VCFLACCSFQANVRVVLKLISDTDIVKCTINIIYTCINVTSVFFVYRQPNNTPIDIDFFFALLIVCTVDMAVRPMCEYCSIILDLIRVLVASLSLFFF
jgi:hypothetical protein